MELTKEERANLSRWLWVSKGEYQKTADKLDPKSSEKAWYLKNVKEINDLLKKVIEG